MALFLPPKRGTTYAVGVCDRCKVKHYLDELKPDRNSPGLRVCDKCNDVKDPYRHPARLTENISLRYPRPDTDLSTEE